MDHDVDEDALLNYDDKPAQKVAPAEGAKSDNDRYVAGHSAAFRDFLLCPELQSAIKDCGFEHPSQVQQECIPAAVRGLDIICQGKSGMGKTAVFVISILQQLDVVPGEISALVIAHTRELAFQIGKNFDLFTKYMPNVQTVVLTGGIPKQAQLAEIREKKPSIIVATPGRCLELVRDRAIDLKKVHYFVVDECDNVFGKEDMHKDVKQIYDKLPQEKQVMLFTATMPEEMKQICRGFTKNPQEILIDEDQKLTLYGIKQYYVKLSNDQKNRKLVEILSNYQFNQVVIFVSKVERAKALSALLNENGFDTVAIHSGHSTSERLTLYEKVKNFQVKILVCTDIFARGIDIERVNIVINYDLPESSDTYLHRVGRTGRFGTKGLAISFIVNGTSDEQTLEEIQNRFKAQMETLPAQVSNSTYMN